MEIATQVVLSFPLLAEVSMWKNSIDAELKPARFQAHVQGLVKDVVWWYHYNFFYHFTEIQNEHYNMLLLLATQVYQISAIYTKKSKTIPLGFWLLIAD